MADAAAPEVKAAPPVRFTARLRHMRMSARKMRTVVDLIRGKDYNAAIAIVRSCSKRAAMPCKKLLESAYENAMDIARNKNLEIDGNKLHLVEARVDSGPSLKRWRPSSMRRPTGILKRMCHVTFVLEERTLRETRRERTRRQKQDRQKSAAEAKKSLAAPESKKENK